MIEDVDSSKNLLAKYSQGAGIDEPLSELRSGAVSHYAQDGIGSVTSLSNIGGSLANTYVYDSFGNLTSSTGNVTDPYQYTSRDYDSETGLRYYRARYYDATIGRFLSEDPLGFAAGVNSYDYVYGTPMNLGDPEGLCPPGPKKPKRCKIIVGVDNYAGEYFTYLSEIESVFSNAGIDIAFVNSASPANFFIQNLDLRSQGAFGYAPPGTNLAEYDNEAIISAGHALGASTIHIETATGIIISHEIRHQFGLPHGQDIMRPGSDVGPSVFQEMNLGNTGLLHFSPQDATKIRKRCKNLPPPKNKAN